jgi:hypothetical protein
VMHGRSCQEAASAAAAIAVPAAEPARPAWGSAVSTHLRMDRQGAQIELQWPGCVPAALLHVHRETGCIHRTNTARMYATGFHAFQARDLACECNMAPVHSHMTSTRRAGPSLREQHPAARQTTSLDNRERAACSKVCKGHPRSARGGHRLRGAHFASASCAAQSHAPL